MVEKEILTQKIKAAGYELGFDMVGVSEATFLKEEARDLEQWLREGKHGKMAYMENYFDKRVDPRLLVEGAQSVISLIHNYFPETEDCQPKNAPKISTYAWGEDYHKVLKRKLYQLFTQIQAWVGAEVPGRVFVDSAPVMDKAWAKRSGLGWIGKHTNLITPKRGSWFFIGEIILDLELVYDGPVKDHCGTCTRCIDACPTDALSPYQIDANKCISYLTIELKEEIHESFSGKMEGWAYGCDICQEVCPWNRFSTPHPGGEFKPLSHISSLTQNDWEEITEKMFKKLTKKSAMNRVKWEKFRGNIQFLAEDR
ncbi:MAG: tRNA epoxyqueuosine(34) reductase QueG [Bacteroidetes bacterium]|nr:tRNA epoxyqueuosine(34) reductase QueG [Bacteroidota bacterium]